MRIAEWPQRKCREHVQGPYGKMGLCEIPEDNAGAGHGGPCATYDVPMSVKIRDRWEADHPNEL